MARDIVQWNFPVRLNEGTEDRHVVLEADAGVRAALARSLGLRGLPRLTAEFDIRRRATDEWQVVGTVSATVEQTCVVSLEPMASEVREPVEIIYSAAAPPRGDDDEMPLRQHGAETPEPPEPLVEGTADLGALAMEFLVLGIDPYPRKPGAVFEPPAATDASEHPFAALSSLRRVPGKQD